MVGLFQVVFMECKIGISEMSNLCTFFDFAVIFGHILYTNIVWELVEHSLKLTWNAIYYTFIDMY